MTTFLFKRLNQLFGLKKYIVVAVEKASGQSKQFVVVSRKQHAAVSEVSKQLDLQQYDVTTYTKVQYAHMLKLKY
ncbi:hypothetical protein QN089_06165 [Kurthia sp. YJT4]|uniref:hypothetical protein n=1 Tax=Kurthia sp. YJT4 TaxID=3049086 RepID=UPI0025519A21|nr:hypothetical protein [Kurthia sp. YJT4]WIL39840.1 hypothetical protein QN089_06165 [Kurthia sp. YJT4]